MGKKMATNETLIKDLLKELSGIEIAILRERIVTIMDATKQSIENNPNEWEKYIISPTLYIGLQEKVNKFLGFGKTELF
jgi:hypothetical protein